MKGERLPGVRHALADFRRTWGQLFLLTLATRFAVSLLVAIGAEVGNLSVVNY